MDLQSEYFHRNGMNGLVGVQDSILLMSGTERRKSLYLILNSISPRSYYSCDKCLQKTLSTDIFHIQEGNFSFSITHHYHDQDDNLLESVRKYIDDKTLLPIRVNSIDSMIAYIWNHITGSSVKTEKIYHAIMKHYSAENVKIFLKIIRDVTTNRKYLIS